MSVSKQSTWNRTTSLERDYRGRSRGCHHPLQPARPSRHLHHRHGRPTASHRRNRPAAAPALFIASRRKERRFQRLGDIPVAGPVDVHWSKYRSSCEEPRARGCRFLNPRPRFRAVPAPRAGSGTSLNAWSRCQTATFLTGKSPQSLYRSFIPILSRPRDTPLGI